MEKENKDNQNHETDFYYSTFMFSFINTKLTHYTKEPPTLPSFMVIYTEKK